MKTPNRLKNVFIGVVILAIILLGIGWLYLQSQDTALEIITDKPAYFATDNPELQIVLRNPKGANEGEVIVNYPESLISIMESEVATGVNMRNMDNAIVFELSDEYFKNYTAVIATLKMEKVEREQIDIEFDQEKSSLNSPEGAVQVASYKDAHFAYGQAGGRR
ncbi:hypothetical protein ACFL3C_03590 [Patescibacteria group bacterium]